MKKQKSFSRFDLRADALDYLFVEWLVRNRLYRKFARNIVADRPGTTSARELIRQRSYAYAKFSAINYSYLLTGAFLFDSTPEGREFWICASQRWADFCEYFFSILTQSR